MHACGKLQEKKKKGNFKKLELQLTTLVNWLGSYKSFSWLRFITLRSRKIYLYFNLSIRMAVRCIKHENDVPSSGHYDYRSACYRNFIENYQNYPMLVHIKSLSSIIFSPEYFRGVCYFSRKSQFCYNIRGYHLQKC